MPRPFAVAGLTMFATVMFLGNCETGVMIYAFFAFFIALVIALLINESRKQRVFPLSMLSGALTCVLLISFNVFVYEPVIAYDGSTSTIKAQLTDYPELRYGNAYCNAKVTEIDGEAVDMDIRLTFGDVPDAEPYDLVEGSFTFYRPGFTGEEYLNSNKAKGLYIGAYSVGAEPVFTAVPESEKPFMFRIVTLRREIRNAVYRALPDGRGALATALLIGDKSDLDNATYTKFVDSGFVHIICVSGFHLSLWANLILWFFRKLGLNIKISSVFAAAGVVFFMLVAGLTPSVLRSGIMTLLFLAGNVLSRKRDSLNSLGFALLAMGLYNPMILSGIGLQLSALSTLGIILYNLYIAPKTAVFFRKFGDSLLADFAESLFSSLCLTAGAIIFIQPISLMTFGRFSFAVFVSNIFVTWIAGVSIVLSACAAAASFIIPFQYNFFAHLAGFFLKIILKASEFFSELTMFMFSVEYDNAAFIIAIVFLFCAAAFFLAYCGKSKPVLASVLCFCVFSLGVLLTSAPERTETKARVVDTGNGTAVCFSKNGENVLIGCGGTDFSSAFALTEALQSCSGGLDALVLPDSSVHSASQSVQIIREFNPGVVFASELSDEAALVAEDERTKNLNEEYNTENFTIKSYQNGGEVYTAVETEDSSYLILFDPVSDMALIPPDFADADVLITRGDYPQGAEGCFDLIVLNSENVRGVAVQNELLSSGVNCAATAGCGDIIIRSSDGYISAYRA